MTILCSAPNVGDREVACESFLGVWRALGYDITQLHATTESHVCTIKISRHIASKLDFSDPARELSTPYFVPTLGTTLVAFYG